MENTTFAREMRALEGLDGLTDEQFRSLSDSGIIGDCIEAAKKIGDLDKRRLAVRIALGLHKKDLLPTVVAVNADLDPRTPSDLSLTGEGTEHRKLGIVFLEKREDGRLYANGREIVRRRISEQIDGKDVQGHKLRRKLKNGQALNACIMDALFANPQLIPGEWLSGETYFWGTVFRNAAGRLYVEYLHWRGNRWRRSYRWLDDGWYEFAYAAELAS
ncbi:MAG TPA: hypothetical protein VMT81_03270 [Candidatus Paceibacterota bacterium]|nr:hypothetical protein [Candidatus Paceibacterota bacterium]